MNKLNFPYKENTMDGVFENYIAHGKTDYRVYGIDVFHLALV